MSNLCDNIWKVCCHDHKVIVHKTHFLRVLSGGFRSCFHVFNNFSLFLRFSSLRSPESLYHVIPLGQYNSLLVIILEKVLILNIDAKHLCCYECFVSFRWPQAIPCCIQSSGYLEKLSNELQFPCRGVKRLCDVYCQALDSWHFSAQ